MAHYVSSLPPVRHNPVLAHDDIGNADEAFVRTQAAMGTVVSVHVVGHGASQKARRHREHAVERALLWFTQVESVCSRFLTTSELRQLSNHVGTAVPVSAMLYEAVYFACAVATATDGAFDPTVGHQMEARGFTREYTTGAHAAALLQTPDDISYHDVVLDANARTIRLVRPLVLDLGAVAKGLAVDMAARELAAFENFVIDAGGDVYAGGHNANGDAWRIGIRHPATITECIETVTVRDAAVCTTGMYERGPHIIDASTRQTPAQLISATVIASSAMVADALATAAFVLGPTEGLAFLEHHAVSALLLTPALDRITTDNWPSGATTP